MHITELLWEEISGRLSKQLKFIHDTVTVSASELVELADDLSAEHAGDHTSMAKQAFATDTPTPEQISKIADALDAAEAMRAVVQAAAGQSVSADSTRPTKMRRMRST